ncbi:hypothetical protein FBY03_103234 [Pseudomonas sp. SJZ079]|nr:hypothetical protein FBY03_103234 [Pseudomonas sp. SJZ079]
MSFSSLLHSLLAAYACGACGASPDEHFAG